MKLPIVSTALFVALATSHVANAATISTKIHNISSSTTQDYVFTQGGLSITLRAVYTPTLNGVTSGAFTSLDGGVHVGNTAYSETGAGNHFTITADGLNAEGFNVSISLLSADPGVNLSSIQFRMDSLGMRGITGNPSAFSWSSSATTIGTTSVTGGIDGQVKSLDGSSFYTNIATVAYTGAWSMTSDGGGTQDYIQLSDSVTGGNGLQMTATFVPEPSVALLGGLSALMLLRRRRL